MMPCMQERKEHIECLFRGGDRKPLIVERRSVWSQVYFLQVLIVSPITRMREPYAYTMGLYSCARKIKEPPLSIR